MTQGADMSEGKRLNDAELAEIVNYNARYGPANGFNDSGSRHRNALLSHIAALTAPPSQGKVERARFEAEAKRQMEAQEMMEDYEAREKGLVWLEGYFDIDALITQALTEPSGQMGPEAAAILRTLGCVPDSTDLSETDAKVSVGFLRRLIESSGQGTGGAQVRVFLQDVIDAMNGDGPAFKWRDDSDSDALDYLGMKAEHLLRALPLPDRGMAGALAKELKRLIQYGRWQISEESPGWHPTLPSAVGAAAETLARYEASTASQPQPERRAMAGADRLQAIIAELKSFPPSPMIDDAIDSLERIS